MKKFLLLMSLFTAMTLASFAQWTTLTSDASGDGQNPNYLDGTKLEYKYDDNTDSIYFRVTVDQYKAYAFGINIIMNIAGAGATGTWWGNQNSSFKYNRLITVWMSNPPMGTVGVTDASGAAANNFTKIAGANKVTVIGDNTAKTYTIRIKRTDIYKGSSLKGDVIAAVGAHNGWNDDLPNTGNGGSIDVQPTTGVKKLSMAEAGYVVAPNPTRGTINISRKTNDNIAQIRVHNTVGQIVLSKEMAGKSISLNLTEYSQGLYYVTILNDKIFTTIPVVLQ